MKSDIKVSCASCCRRYYIHPGDSKRPLPADIQPGDGFVCSCPFCREGEYAILLTKTK